MLKMFPIFVLVALAAGNASQAEDFCARLFVVDDEVSKEHWGSRTEVLPVPGFTKPFIKLGRNEILTITDGRLHRFQGPPLTNWKRLMPNIVIDRQGHIWDYTTIREPALFRLETNGQFERHSFQELNRIDAFADPDWRRGHADRRDRRRLNRDGPIFAIKSGNIYELVGNRLNSVRPPPGWGAHISVPMGFDGVGEFAHVDGRIWFRTGPDGPWAEVARLEDLRSLYSQSPFSIFDVVFNEKTGRLMILLEDRALVGRLDADIHKPVFENQFAGDIVLHALSGKVLVWAGAPLTQNRSDAPELALKDEGLWEMTPETPARVRGFQATARRTSGGIPLTSFIYHEPSGLTLTSHSGGFAAYDGEDLMDLSDWPAGQDGQDDTFMLRNIGSAFFAKGHGRLLKIEQDLSVSEAALPEPVEWLWDVVFSAELGSYFLFSSAWDNTDSTQDFVTFTTLIDAPSGVRSLSGDLPSDQGVFGNSDHEAFVIQLCPESLGTK